MTFLAVSILGAITKVALDAFQADRESERAGWLRQEEQWRRDVENLKDARAREDAFLRSMLEETLRTYNRVKRTRRLLKSLVNCDEGQRVEYSFYDEHLKNLIDDQLRFEELALLSSVASDPRLDPESLMVQYESIADYLNSVISEYEIRLHRLRGQDSLPISEFRSLGAFVAKAFPASGTPGNQADYFGVSVAVPKDKLVKQFQLALLEPLVLPAVPRTPGLD